jgi:hypothetical protein
MSRSPLYVLLFILILMPCKLHAQYFDTGAFAGMSAYIGDLNTDRLFNKVYPAAGAVARFNHNQRLSTRINATYSVLRGSDRNTGKPYNNILNDINYPSVYYAFETSIVELSLQSEFHILPFWPEDFYIAWAPYIFVGAGGLYFSPNPMKFSDDGNLRDHTGGAHWHINDDLGYLNLALVGFAGLGVKYKLSRNLTVSVEIGLRIASTDYLDEVSLKGNPGNNDWYSLTGLTLTYGFDRYRNTHNGHIRHTRPSGHGGVRCLN